VKIKAFLRTERGTVITLAILVAFVCAAISLAMLRIREDLNVATAFNGERVGEHEAWVSFERYFKDHQRCTEFMKGKRLGDAILGGGTFEAPQVGREWKESGWIVKDLYLLREEDEMAWDLPRTDEKQVYLKVSLVPRPHSGEKVGLQYMLNAPTSMRLIPLKVLQAHEQVFAHCGREEAEEACYQLGLKKGVIPKIQVERAPASVKKQCERGVIHQAHCLLPMDDAPIWKCLL